MLLGKYHPTSTSLNIRYNLNSQGVFEARFPSWAPCLPCPSHSHTFPKPLPVFCSLSKSSLSITCDCGPPPPPHLIPQQVLFTLSSSSVQLSSVAQFCLTLGDPMGCSTSGLPVHHQLLEFIQTHVHWVSDAIQPSHPLSSPSPSALNLSQHQSLFQWVSSLHQVAKVLEFQLQHHSFQWIFRTDFL